MPPPLSCTRHVEEEPEGVAPQTTDARFILELIEKMDTPDPVKAKAIQQEIRARHLEAVEGTPPELEANILAALVELSAEEKAKLLAIQKKCPTGHVPGVHDAKGHLNLLKKLRIQKR